MIQYHNILLVKSYKRAELKLKNIILTFLNHTTVSHLRLLLLLLLLGLFTNGAATDELGLSLNACKYRASALRRRLFGVAFFPVLCS
jgi:hypothetical protein